MLNGEIMSAMGNIYESDNIMDTPIHNLVKGRILNDEQTTRREVLRLMAFTAAAAVVSCRRVQD